MQRAKDSIVFKILLYLVVLQLKNCACENMTEDRESKPFGSLEDDWRRLDLLQSLQPKNSVLGADLVKACRLLLSALYQSTSTNLQQQSPTKIASFVQNSSVHFSTNLTKSDEDYNNRKNRLIVTTERLLRLYNTSAENTDLKLQKTNTGDNSHKLKPIINRHDSRIMNSKTRGNYEHIITTTLLPFYNAALKNSSTLSEGNKAIQNKSLLNAFDKPSEAGFDRGTDSFEAKNFDHKRDEKAHNNYLNNEMRGINSSARCGKSNQFKFPEHVFNWTDTHSLSTTESDMSLQYFNINIFQNTYIGSTTNASDNGSRLAPTEAVPLRSEILHDFQNLVKKVGVTKNKFDSNSSHSLQGFDRNVDYTDYKNLTNFNGNDIEKENIQSIAKKIGVTDDKSFSNNNSNYSMTGMRIAAEGEDSNLKSDGKEGSCSVNSNSTSSRETLLSDISLKDSTINSSIFSDKTLKNLNENLNQEIDSLDKNQGVLLTFNDKVVPNITAVNNGQLLSVPQEQVEEIADLDKVVQKFLDSLYNGSIHVKKDDGSLLQDDNILILQGNVTDANNAEINANLKSLSTNELNLNTNQSNVVMSNQDAAQNHLKSSNSSQEIVDNEMRGNLKQASDNVSINQSYNSSRENNGEMQANMKHSNLSNTSSTEAVGENQVDSQPALNVNAKESAINRSAGQIQENLTQLYNRKESPINGLAGETQGNLSQLSNTKELPNILADEMRGNMSHLSNRSYEMIKGNKLRQNSNTLIEMESPNNELKKSATQSMFEQKNSMVGLENNYTYENGSYSSLNQSKNILNSSKSEIKEHFKPTSWIENTGLINSSRSCGSSNAEAYYKKGNELMNLKSHRNEIENMVKPSSTNQSDGLSNIRRDDIQMQLKPTNFNRTNNKLIECHDDEIKGNLTVSHFYQSDKLTNSGIYDDINNMKSSSYSNQSHSKSQKNEMNDNLKLSRGNDWYNFDDEMKTDSKPTNLNNNTSIEFSNSTNMLQVDAIKGGQLYCNHSNKELTNFTNNDTGNSKLSSLVQSHGLNSLGRNYSNVQLNNKHDMDSTMNSNKNSNSTANEDTDNNHRIISMPLKNSKISNSSINKKSASTSDPYSYNVDNRLEKTIISINREYPSNVTSHSEDRLDISKKRSETSSVDLNKASNDLLVKSVSQSNDPIRYRNASSNISLSVNPEQRLNNDESIVLFVDEVCNSNKEKEIIAQ
ncbi:putative uncharacterized protein DDB_G0282133 [Nilaparvata lugens]|uniref:putative uncharacterized protein DDB_G0282133 n=1 Tax=Nilaparvata lugens TaxID=108931 RepID=UPI00193EA0E8|nr:putative uncharacterized protein DDB_G0282133 [Nilaparvata lugens]